MKSFSERNPLIMGVIFAIVTPLTLYVFLNYQKLPLLNSPKSYSAYFSEAGGLYNNAIVQVSGLAAGRVSSIALEDSGTRVRVKFKVDRGVHLGDRTEASIKSKGLLGAKILDVTPRGGGKLTGPIPVERTTAPYQLGDTVSDLTTTLSGISTTQLSDSLSVLANTFSNTPASLKGAVKQVGRLAETLDKRDAHLRDLLKNANKTTGVLANRIDQVVSLVKDTNALLAELRTESAALDQFADNVSNVTLQLKGFVAENREQLKPMLDKLNGVLTIVDLQKERIKDALPRLNNYAISLGEAINAGPFFKAYVPNVAPGQFLQPFIEAAFDELGLDPSVLAPSEIFDPQIGQRGTPPMPLPYPRTGQGGPPRLTIPDAITGNPPDSFCSAPWLPGPNCYPLREEPPAPPAGGMQPGPPAPTPPELLAPPEHAGVPRIVQQDVGPRDDLGRLMVPGAQQ